MGKRVTVYDIAEELKISPSTVSRVLNRSTLISDERSEQILMTAERMGYQKRSIKKHVSRAILNIHLFLPQAESTITHFFYNISELIESVQEGFGDVRLNFVTRVNDGNLDFLEKKKTGQIDGCIFAFTKPNGELSRELKSREIPFVMLNRKGRSGSYICYDVCEGIAAMAEKLFALKGEDLRPCFIGYKGLPELSETRYRCIENTLCSRGLVFSEENNRRDISEFIEISQSIIGWIQESGFNAVFSFNDMAAASLLQSAMARGLRVPQDLALTGVDDSPIQNMLDRRIDTVSLSVHELGLRAGRWLRGFIIEKTEGLIREVLTGPYLPGDTISE